MLDHAWSVVLGELDPRLHEPMKAYITAKRSEFDARDALSTVLTATGSRWHTADRIARELAFPED